MQLLGAQYLCGNQTLARALGVLSGGDRVLVKGSRAMRMERLVERIATEAAAGSRS